MHSPWGYSCGNILGMRLPIFTIANAVSPATMIGGGYINDKIGPKGVLLVGGLLFGAGMICSGFARSVGMLIVTYGLGAGLGVGLAYSITVSNTIKFSLTRVDLRAV